MILRVFSNLDHSVILWFSGIFAFLLFHFTSSFLNFSECLEHSRLILISLCYQFCFCIVTSWPAVSHSPHLRICWQDLPVCQICKFSVYLAFPLLFYMFVPYQNFTFILSCGFSLGIFSLVEPLRLHFLHELIPERAYQCVTSHCNGLLFSPCPIFCCLGNHFINFSYSYP